MNRDDDSVQPWCRQPPPEELLLAVRQFNSGSYFDCHETLEELWLETAEPERRFYQGLLQVAVGLYHLQRGNAAGAISLLGRGSDLLRSFAPVCRGVDVAGLCEAAGLLGARVEAAGATARLAATEQLPRVQLVAAAGAGDAPSTISD